MPRLNGRPPKYRHHKASGRGYVEIGGRAAHHHVGIHPVHAGHQSSAGDDKGFTGGWYDGRTVDFFYNKDFFCADDNGTLSGADSNCALAVEPERARLEVDRGRSGGGAGSSRSGRSLCVSSWSGSSRCTAATP